MSRIRKIYLDPDGIAKLYELKTYDARGNVVWRPIPDPDVQRGLYINGILHGPSELRRLADFYMNYGLDEVYEKREDGLYRWETRERDFIKVQDLHS